MNAVIICGVSEQEELKAMVKVGAGVLCLAGGGVLAGDETFRWHANGALFALGLLLLMVGVVLLVTARSTPAQEVEPEVREERVETWLWPTR